MQRKNNIKKIAVIGIFCAMAYLVAFVFRIDVQFLTFDIKDSVITLAAMIYGPISAVVMSFIVAVIESFSIGNTGPYGLIMDIISTLTFSVTASLIYSRSKKLWSAVVGLASAVVVTTGIMMVANLIITPLFLTASRADVVALMPKLLLPFNAAKSIFNMAVVLFIYKPLSTALKKAGVLAYEKSAKDGYSFNKTTLGIAITALVLVALSILIFIFVLDGSVTFF